MPQSEGIIVFDKREIGTFVVHEWPFERVEAKFKEGLRVQDLFEYAAEQGMAVELLLTLPTDY